MRKTITGLLAGGCLLAGSAMAQQSSQQGLEQAVDETEAELAEIATRREALLMELQAVRAQLEASDMRMQDKEREVDALQRELDAPAE